MGRGNIFCKIVNILPYKMFISLYPKLQKSKFGDAADSIFYSKMLRSSSLIKDKEILVSLRTKQQPMLIKRGIWNYKIANFCFVKDMLSIIIWCVESGYTPVVDIFPPKDGYYSDNTYSLWDLFYLQPLQTGYKKEITNETVCPIISSGIHARFSDVRDSEKVQFWHDMLETFVVYNEKTMAYFEDEYYRLIKGKRVVACVLRSTDYTKLCPKGHPIQPSVEETFVKLREVMRKYEIEYVYLATEDLYIAEAFRKEFPNHVIENKRRYFMSSITIKILRWCRRFILIVKMMIT